MSLVRELPLRQKLTWLAMTCSMVALLAAAVAMAAYEWRFYRRTLFTYLTTLSTVTARNSAAAVAFANNEDAARILAALETEPSIVAAVLYDSGGRRFAEFRRRGIDVDSTLPADAPQDGLVISGAQFRLTVPVAENKRFGTMLVVADVSVIRTRIAGYGIVLLMTTAISGLLAYLLTDWLKQRIVAPIDALAAAALRVQGNADYSVRVAKEADDEVGALTDAFNAMLGRIHQNEMEISRGAERLRLAVESAQIGTWDWDVQRDVVIWNPRNYEIFGIPVGSPVNSSVFFERIHPDDRQRTREAMERAMVSAADFSVEFRVSAPAGADRVRYVAARGQFLKADGVISRAIGVSLDITERRLAELRAIESEMRFRSVAERTPAMIWSCDGALHRDYFNRTWLAFTGRSVERELGNGWQESVPAADLEHWRAISQSAAAEREPYTVEYRLRRADGTLRWLVETGAVRPGADGLFAGYFGSCIDITARKENEAELEAHVRLRTRELEVANQELETFSYSVSHDLRGPVRAIQGFAEIALEELAASDVASAKERIERVLKASDRMNKLIDAFLGIARISRSELSVASVNLSRIAEEVVSFLRAAQPGRKVQFNAQPGLLAQGDERMLRIVLENLLSNAWKFTAQQEVATVTFGAQVSGPDKIFYVRDNGAGFDPHLSHKLFLPFERLHSGSQFEGLGVGLNTVHRIIEKHGGRIWAESTKGEGATFFFTLPASRPAGVPLENRPSLGA